ncbi:Stf0 family sulfotransferase [Falsirhodobacter deserti]|uniref:Stf0 family sulfotransferase n=1 Tax=Falsirhodobacter deserti TaxID=1365611 RepID=UPI0013E3A677|nr:Stf0 family sulfotransferase [Falsirhodobacter deserti]
MDLMKFISQGGIHEKEIRRHFGDRAIFTGDRPVFDHPLYLLAFSNRSGSNLLADHLRSTPVFSGFYEQLNHSTVLQQAEQWNAGTFPDLIRIGSEVLSEGKPIHGFKASWDQILMLHRFRIPAMYDGVKIIHITRDDVLGQAVSYQIAHQTKRWTSMQRGEDVKPVYDKAQISHLIGAAQMSANAIQMLCTIFEMPRIEVTYEEIVARPRKAVLRIGKLLDLDLQDWKSRKPTIARQADAINDSFRARYLAEARTHLLT